MDASLRYRRRSRVGSTRISLVVWSAVDSRMPFTFGSINCFVAERREPPGELPSDVRIFTGQLGLFRYEISVRFANVTFFLNFEFQ